MAELDFTDLTAMNALVVELAGVDSAPSDTDNLLTDSAATHGGTTVYRPYYTAARVLERALNTRRLQSARGAVFDQPSVTIRGLMRQQAARDAMLLEDHADYTIPDGHEATSGSVSTVVF